MQDEGACLCGITYLCWDVGGCVGADVHASTFVILLGNNFYMVEFVVMCL